MILQRLNILNYKNIREADLVFSDKMNGFIGLNGQGKTNLLDAIYLLSFTKSAFNAIDSMNITHGENLSMVSGEYIGSTSEQPTSVTCGLRRGQKKQFRRDKKDYHRLLDHIGRIPLVMVSPTDEGLILDGSDSRRRFMDSVIAQSDSVYLEHLTTYNALLKQRNALLKQLAEQNASDLSILDIYDQQMIPPAEYIFRARQQFTEAFVPHFQSIYCAISGEQEKVALHYVSQLQNRQLGTALQQTRTRDLILGWTSQGVHKDDLEMLLQSDETHAYPIKQVGSQGQQKTYVLAMKLAQSLYLSQNHSATASCEQKPILLLDDIFDKLDAERVKRIVNLVQSEPFGQIFITDTDRQSLSQILQYEPEAKLFEVNQGAIQTIHHNEA